MLHLLPIKRSHLNCQGVAALVLEEALGLAEESCVGLAYAGDNMQKGILEVRMESWLKFFCYIVSCTLKICSIPSSSSSESPTPGSLQGSLDSAVYLTLLWNLIIIYVLLLLKFLDGLKNFSGK